ncbi:uncharacterized protein si:ch73-347e22.8 [Triplophysa dalaica]|uniref:uncharacterized protein si:ch73-347e22.8 n=1 Tax=Triplophysa dalaica TaxID=1582913 RepID=UPI0024E00DF1|nr:uncharacterized protein si:ch73-347e22.8 [Triplophysa dalaica]
MERRSCCPLLLLVIMASVALSLIGYKHIQTELLNEITSELKFSETVQRRTELDLTNLQLEFQNKNMEMDILQKDFNDHDVEIKKEVLVQQKMTEEVKACQDLLAKMNENIAGVEKEKADVEGNFAASKTTWNKDITDFKKQLEQPSQVCAYLKTGTDADGLCPKTIVQNTTQQENKKS